MGYYSDVAICCRAEIYRNFRDHLEEIIKEKNYDVLYEQDAHILAENVKALFDCAQFKTPKTERKFYPTEFKDEDYIIVYWEQIKWYYEYFSDVRVIHDYFKNAVTEDIDYMIIGEDYDDVKVISHGLGFLWVQRSIESY